MEEAGSKAPTAQQITAIKAAIQNAQTLKEVEELEKALVTGHVPSEFKVGSLRHLLIGGIFKSCLQVRHGRRLDLDSQQLQN